MKKYIFWVCLLGLLLTPGLASATNIILAGGYYISDADIVMNQDGVMKFTRGSTDHRVWQLDTRYVEGLSDTRPQNRTYMPPANLARYMQTVGPEVGPVPVAETSGNASGESETRVVYVQPRLHAAKSLAGLMSFYGNLGSSAYNMQSIGTWIDDSNSFGLVPAEPKIYGGLSLSGGFNYWVADNFQFGIELAWLDAYTSGGDINYGEEIRLPALEAGVYFKLGQRISDNFILSGGVGVYGLELAGARIDDYYLTGYPNDHYDLTGSTVAVKLMASADWLLIPGLGIGLDMGYRFAHINDVQVSFNGAASAPLYYKDNSRLTVDYSGFYMQGGIRVYFR